MDSPGPSLPTGQHSSNEQLPDVRPAAFESSFLYRMQWPASGQISDDQLLDDAGIPLPPFNGHPIASAPISNPPCSVIRIGISALGARTSEMEDDKAPESLKIQMLDGSPVTVREFIIAIHAYMQAHKKEITYGNNVKKFRGKKLLDHERWVNIPLDTRFNFAATTCYKPDYGYEVSYLWLELAHDGEEEEWKNIEEQWVLL